MSGDVVDEILGSYIRSSARTPKGGRRLVPLDGHPTMLIFTTRRIRMSVDRKVEMLGIQEVVPAGLMSVEHVELYDKLLTMGVELHWGGLIRRTPRFVHLEALRKLRGVLGIKELSTELIEALEGSAELLEYVKRASPDLLEIHVEMLPSRFCEAPLELSGNLGSLLKRLVSEYRLKPRRIAWYVRSQFLYGGPTMKRKIKRNFELLNRLSYFLEGFTLKRMRR